MHCLNLKAKPDYENSIVFGGESPETGYKIGGQMAMRSKQLVIISFLLLCGIYSCKKNSANPLNIDGKWYVEKNFDAVYANNLLLDSATSTFSDGLYFQFNGDNTGSEGLSGQTTPVSFSYQLNKNTLTITNNINGTISTKNYTITSSTLNNLNFESIDYSNSGNSTEKIIEDTYLSK